MYPKSSASRGGHTTTAKLRAAYNADPHICKGCEAPILWSSGSLTEVKTKQFCTRSCAASFNNKVTPKRIRRKHICQRCPAEVSEPGRCCTQCKDGRPRTRSLIKGELFSTGSWQAARSSIQKHARRIYLQSGKPQQCKVCGYTAHIHIAHRKAVADFPDEATLAEINDIINLVALCPNHHWEFDHGLLIL